MTAMCGLEPLFKGSQFPTSRQQVASPLSVTSRVLSTANLQRAKARLQEGDIIFRTRDTWLARLPASMTAHTAYAQAGIVTFERSQPMVVTPTTGEAGTRLVEEPVADFLQSSDTTRAAIYRLKASRPSMQRAIATAAKSYATANVSSSAKFKLTQDGGYCADFIRCAYLEAGIDLSSRDLESLLWPLQQVRPTPFENVSFQPAY